MIVTKNNRPADLHSLDYRNWVEAGDVKVRFSIGHDGSNIYLSYEVEEPQVRAVNTGFNSRVWEDSCVEFFFSPEGYGKEHNEREWLPESALSEINTAPSLGWKVIESRDELTTWILSVRIPVTVLCYSSIQNLSGMKATANFYKCGDLLKEPHFLSWKPVHNDQPDFHLPAYFGELVFE